MKQLLGLPNYRITCKNKCKMDSFLARRKSCTSVFFGLNYPYLGKQASIERNLCVKQFFSPPPCVSPDWRLRQHKAPMWRNTLMSDFHVCQAKSTRWLFSPAHLG